MTVFTVGSSKTIAKPIFGSALGTLENNVFVTILPRHCLVINKMFF